MLKLKEFDMKKLTLVYFAGFLGFAGPLVAEVTSDDINRYFEDELGNRDVLTAYKSRVEMELQFFKICTQGSDLQEAMQAREAGVSLQKKRKALREQILELKNKNRDAFNMLTLTTTDLVQASYEAQRTCVAHAANLSLLESPN